MNYYKQNKGYTCGCACVKMALSHFESVLPEEEELEELLGTNDRTGTDPIKIKLYFQELGYDVQDKENSNLKEIDSYHKNGYVVLLAISVDVPHFTVYNGHNGNHIEFFDPFFGIIHRTIKNFESDKTTYPFYRWRVDSKEFVKYIPEVDFSDKNLNKYFLAIKK